ncbi:hypothetical protein AAF712_016617, partial [Marasmius tenuissimus]
MIEEERAEYGATQLGIQEGELRQSHAYEVVNNLHINCRKIEVLVLNKHQSVSTEKVCTRNQKSINNALDVCMRLLAVYNHNRQMLTELNIIAEDDDQLLPLSPSNTERKDVNQRRRMTDSKCQDRTLWTVGPTVLKKLPNIPLSSGLVEAAKKSKQENQDPAGPKKPKNAQEEQEAKHDKRFTKPAVDNKGLLWTMGSRRGLKRDDPATLDTFQETGDRISWTCQQAEVFHWMEEFERKHVEFHRMIRYYWRMEVAWKTITENPQAPPNTVRRIDNNAETRAAKVNALKAPLRVIEFSQVSKE